MKESTSIELTRMRNARLRRCHYEAIRAYFELPLKGCLQTMFLQYFMEQLHLEIL
ncbi:unnamed protein product [Brugia timori]|uniref:FERM domain-containing protein n=1 Tax=Brugia timori TaxID=42155 RepID=A0A0R3R3T7_9BILA|nr:unnamed protein product [Brugia timori]